MARCLVPLLLVSFLAAPSSRAGDLDFILTPDPLDDAQVLGHVLNDVFKPDPGDLRALYHAFPDPGEVLAPALFLSSRHGIDVSRIIDLRLGGRNWNDIFVHFGVAPEVVFVDLPRDPGPPYGKAWGYWSKHGGRKKGKPPVLTDREFVDWISLGVTADYFQIDPSAVAGMRAAGTPFHRIIGGQYRDKHKDKGGPGKNGHGSSAPGSQDKDGKKQDKGKGKGKGKR